MVARTTHRPSAASRAPWGDERVAQGEIRLARGGGANRRSTGGEQQVAYSAIRTRGGSHGAARRGKLRRRGGMARRRRLHGYFGQGQGGLRIRPVPVGSGAAYPDPRRRAGKTGRPPVRHTALPDPGGEPPGGKGRAHGRGVARPRGGRRQPRANDLNATPGI